MTGSASKLTSGSWSRNLRTLGRCSVDSDSSGTQSPVGQKQSTATNKPAFVSEDARLIQQMDLASRHDEAVYKPNPWSIAKVNAAVRPQPQQEKAKHTGSAPKKQPQGQIVEGFKRQMKKSQTRTRPNAAPDASRERSISAARVLKSSNDRTMHPCPRPPSSQQQIDSINKNTQLHVQPSPNFATRDSPSPAHPQSQPSMHNSTPSHVSGHTAGNKIIPALPIPGMGRDQLHIAYRKQRPEGLDVHRQPAHHIKQPMRGPSHFAEQMEIGAARFGHRQLLPIYPTFHGEIMSSPTYTSIKASSLRPDIARQAFSSPPRVPYSSGASVSGPSRKRPYSSALCDFQDIPVQQSVSPHSSDRHLGPNARTYLPVVPPLRRPRKSTPPRNSSPDSSLLTRLPERDPYDLLSSPEANWSTLPTKKKMNSSKRPGQSSSATSAKFRLPLATSTVAAAEPDAKRRRVSYLPPPPPPQKFAYRKTPSTDADNKKPTSWKVTRVLPGQILQKLAREDRSAAPSMSRSRPSQQRGHSVNEVKTHSTNQMGRAYPSPPHRRSSPPSESLPSLSPALATQTLPAVVESSGSTSNYANGVSSQHMPSRNSLPSPPRSDSPSELSSDISQQLRLPFSTRTLEDRYPKMRKAVAERKRAVAGVWDELELPSCGVIYQSPTSSPSNPHLRTQRTREELPIVKWEGRKTYD